MKTLYRRLNSEVYERLARKHQKSNNLYVLMVLGLVVSSIFLNFSLFVSTFYYIAGVNSLRSFEQTNDTAHLTQAYDLLALTVRLDPDNASAQQAFARVTTYQGNHQEALVAIERAYRSDPSNLQIKQELVKAYYSIGQIRRADQILVQAGISHEAMIYLGDDNIAHQRYNEAYFWYAQVERLRPDLRQSLKLRRAVTELLRKQSLSTGNIEWNDLLPYHFDVSPSKPQKIEGNKFLRFDGTQLADIAGDGSGTFWWSGPALAVVNVAQKEKYTITTQLFHNDPPPIKMQILIDGDIVREVILARGDQTWEVESVDITLERGEHVILVNFINDGSFLGKNRDGRIGWLHIELTN